MFHKNEDQSHVQDHALHQHPHEGHKEEVVEEDSYDLAVDGDWVIFVPNTSHTNHKDELSYPKTDAEVDVNEIPHAVQ